jgi:glycosyltransferase involved in cell wall biosynthesis
MRIVYLHQYFRPPTGVGSTRSYEFAKRLAARGHDVHVVTTRRTGEPFRGWHEDSLEGFTVHSTYVPYSHTMSIRQRLRSFVAYALRASRMARRLRADVIFATSTPLTIAIPAVTAQLGRGTPIVFEVRDLWPEVPIAMGALTGNITQRAAYGLQRLAYSRSAHIVALSPDMKRGIAQRGVSEDDITVIPNSSDVDFFASPAHREIESFRERLAAGDRQIVLYAGTLGRVNDTRYLVRVAHASANLGHSHQFVVVGDGVERAPVERAAREIGILGKNFHLVSPVSKTEMPAIFASASLTVSTVAPIPELWANSANKFFDSFAAGRPIMINHEGWQADVLRSSGAGIVVDPHDPESAARALDELLTDPVKLTAAGAAARSLGVDRYSRDIHASQLTEILERFGKRSR